MTKKRRIVVSVLVAVAAFAFGFWITAPTCRSDPEVCDNALGMSWPYREVPLDPLGLGLVGGLTASGISLLAIAIVMRIRRSQPPSAR